MRGLKLGRLFGIEIGIDRSWIFIFILLTWNLTAVFGQWHPLWPPAMTLFLAALAAVLFFGSVVVHELCHALVARRFGIPVRNITLFLFGGVSNIEREPPSAKAEFWMAVVGPLASVGLGVAFIVLAQLTMFARPIDADNAVELMAALGPIPTLLTWLGPVNIVVGLFNLIPGFPLDGGRILRAGLWKATGDLHKATRWAAGAGQAVGWAFIAAGIAMVFGARIPIFGSGIVGGLWLAFIGWFLSAAAEQSYTRLLVQDVLEDVTVARLMRTRGAAIPADAPLVDVVNQWFLKSDEHAFPVMDGDAFLGLICLEDVRRAPQGEWDTKTAADVMTPAEALVTATPDEPVSEALAKLTSRDVSQLPVVSGGRLVGILERRDIARWIELRLGPQGGPPQGVAHAR